MKSFKQQRLGQIYANEDEFIDDVFSGERRNYLKDIEEYDQDAIDYVADDQNFKRLNQDYDGFCRVDWTTQGYEKELLKGDKKLKDGAEEYLNSIEDNSAFKLKTWKYFDERRKTLFSKKIKNSSLTPFTPIQGKGVNGRYQKRNGKPRKIMKIRMKTHRKPKRRRKGRMEEESFPNTTGKKLRMKQTSINSMFNTKKQSSSRNFKLGEKMGDKNSRGRGDNTLFKTTNPFMNVKGQRGKETSFNKLFDTNF